MADLPTIDDVARVLRVDTDNLSVDDQADIEEALEVALSWARNYLRNPTLGEVGENTQSFYGETVVPYTGEVVKVEAYAFPGATPTELDPDNYRADGKRIRVLYPSWIWPGLPAEERAMTRDMASWRIDVTTTDADQVDPVVRDGIALAAGALWQRSPRLTRGLTGEHIGDYSYSTQAVQAAGDPFFAEAKSLLKPFRRRSGLVV